MRDALFYQPPQEFVLRGHASTRALIEGANSAYAKNSLGTTSNSQPKGEVSLTTQALASPPSFFLCVEGLNLGKGWAPLPPLSPALPSCAAVAAAAVLLPTLTHTLRGASELGAEPVSSVRQPTIRPHKATLTC